MTLKRSLEKGSASNAVAIELRDARSTSPQSPPETQLGRGEAMATTWVFRDAFKRMPGDPFSLVPSQSPSILATITLSP